MEEIKKHIRNVPNFPLEGIQFKDISPLLQNPKAFSECIKRLASQWGSQDLDSIGGFDARGFIFGTPLAYELGKPFFPLRKSGKLPYDTISESYGLEYGKDNLELHTDAVRKGDRVLLLDDLLATGGTMKAGCDLVERLGGEIVGCQFVIELEGLKGRDKIPNYDIYSMVKYGEND